MLDVRSRQAIVVGGSRMAAEKAASLAASGAHVRALSPQFHAQLMQLAERGLVTLLTKAYEPGDLADAFVVVAVTTDQQEIEAIWQETQKRGQLVNIADVPQYCSFILPSILRRGEINVSFFSEGGKPRTWKTAAHTQQKTLSRS